MRGLRDDATQCRTFCSHAAHCAHFFSKAPSPQLLNTASHSLSLLQAYDHTASSTSKAAFPYKFSNSYQTCDLQDPTAVCTISGGLYTDLASLAGLGPVEVQVGSVEKQTSNFDQFKVIDGVMGFTAPSKKNVFSQLVDAGKSANVWAMCMYDGAISNGTITIGGVDPRLSVNGKVNYVPDSGRGFHSVEVASITLAPAVVKDNAVAMSSVTAAAAAPIPVQKSGILVRFHHIYFHSSV